jgi:hypothetical protein
MSGREIEVDGQIFRFPEVRFYVEPVLGELIELRLYSVENLLYAIVEECTFSDRWMLCYVTCLEGWRFLWLFRAVRPNDVTEPLIPGNDNVVDLYHMVDGDEGIVAVVEESDGWRTISFVLLSDESAPLLLRLRCELPQYDCEDDDS